jgi:Cd(II)/Pb(II)-responsive transcriptional regulator
MLNIGKLAKLTSCLPVTIRYYEKMGLIKDPGRKDNGYRSYEQEDVERLNFIKHCREHGMRLKEIKSLLRLRQEPEQDCSKINEILDKHIEKLENDIKSILNLKKLLVELKNKCPQVGIVANCGILKGLIDKSHCSCQGQNLKAKD